jgi:hypothetical protein
MDYETYRGTWPGRLLCKGGFAMYFSVACRKLAFHSPVPSHPIYMRGVCRSPRLAGNSLCVAVILHTDVQVHLVFLLTEASYSHNKHEMLSCKLWHLALQ